MLKSVSMQIRPTDTLPVVEQPIDSILEPPMRAVPIGRGPDSDNPVDIGSDPFYRADYNYLNQDDYNYVANDDLNTV